MSEYSNHPFDLESTNNSWSNLYKYIPERSRVLDVGCSTGIFGAALKDLKNCEVIGIDIDEADISVAKTNMDAAYVMDADSDKLLDLGKFDVIIFADVLEHLVDPRQTLRSIKKVLKPKGIVIFSIPHMAHMSVRLELLSGSFPYKNVGLVDRTHLHFYDKKEVESVFEESGFMLQLMNPVLSEYPPQMIKDKLQATGLKYTEAFMKHLLNTYGNIFQFVGCARPSEKSNVSLTTEYIMPQDEIKTYVESVLNENRRLWESEERLKQQLADLEASLSLEKSRRPAELLVKRAAKKVARRVKRNIGNNMNNNKDQA